MTWGEFKAAMEESGVTDMDNISYIDVGRVDASAVDIVRSRPLPKSEPYQVWVEVSS